MKTQRTFEKNTDIDDMLMYVDEQIEGGYFTLTEITITIEKENK